MPVTATSVSLAKRLVNFGLKSVKTPSRSWQSRICPSVPTPAPMPMVGIVSCSEISLAIFAGTASNSSMKQPASSMASASSRIFMAASAVRPWILKPPNMAMVCGVRPMCEAVGMPASTSAFRICAWDLPPCGLTASEPACCMKRVAFVQRAVDGVVALVGHAPQHEGVGRAAADRLRVHHHHVHGGGDGGGMAVRDHGQAVADHGHVDARHLRPLGARVVGHRHVDHLLAGLLQLADLGDGALLALLLRHGASLLACVMGPPSRRRWRPRI